MYNRNILVVTLFVLLLASVNYARTFPSTTSDTVAPFADQLTTSSLSDAQVAFFANNYYGTQKQYATQIARYRAVNPNFLGLHYRLAQEAGPAPGIAHDSNSDGAVNGNLYSSEEWTNYAQNQDWYIIGTDGQRVRNSAWDWYPFDLLRSTTLRNQIADYWVNRVTLEAQATQSDGVFADSAGQLIPPYQTPAALPNYFPASPNFDLTAGRNFISNGYAPYSARVWSGLQQQNVTYLPNLGQMITGWDNINNYVNSDGGMIEGFTGFGSSITDVNDWKLEMNNMLTLARSNKILIAQTPFDTVNDYNRRSFIIGSYLIGKGSKSYVYMYSGSYDQWYPEYDLDMGAYSGAIPNNVDELAWNGVYRRNYENGMVLVNPTATPVSVNLGANYNQAVFNGGGNLPANAARPGSITYTQVNSVNVPARGAVFLLTIANQPVDADQDGYNSLVDCNDNNALVNPGRVEVPGNGIDDDCNAATLDSIQGDANVFGQIATVGSDTTAHYSERSAGVTGATNYIINDVVGDGLGTQLSDNQGLYVYTPRATVTAYYRVTDANNAPVANLQAFHRNGQTFITWTENGAATYKIYREQSASAGSITVQETNNPIQPVLSWQQGGRRVYTLYLPQDAWNAQIYQGQGHNFYVGAPNGYNYNSPARISLTVHMEGRGSRYTSNPGGLVGTGGSSYDSNTIYVRVDEPPVPTYDQGWYFGHLCTPANPAQGVCNYLENAILETVLALERNSNYNIDPDRVYAYGHSMGATGALRLGIRYPEVFAAVYASEPVTDFATTGNAGGTSWVNDVSDSRGTQAQNLPFHSVGVSRTYLSQFDGQPIWTYENITNFICANKQRSTAVLSMAHGTIDNVVDTDTQGYPFYQAATNCKTGFQANINSADHTWQGFSGMGPMLMNPSRPYVQEVFNAYQFTKASFPAFSNAQNSKNPTTTGTGSFNEDLTWAIRQDTANTWEALLTSTSTNQRVDVTPRRARLGVAANQQFNWARKDAQGNTLESGQVQADASGLVFVPQVLVTTAGNILTITAGAIGPDVTAPTISSLNAAPSQTSATVTFNTNEASSATLEYGLTTNYGTVQSQTSATTHSFTLNTLNSNTTYYYRVNATDASNNRATQTGTFTTQAVQVNIDADGDGFFLNAAPLDCDDSNALVNPSRQEIIGNGLDDDCNPLTPDVIAAVDADADGYNSTVDCNDNSALVNPGRVEVPGNGIDDDCNAATLDNPIVNQSNQTPTGTFTINLLKDTYMFPTYSNQGANTALKMYKEQGNPSTRILLQFNTTQLTNQLNALNANLVYAKIKLYHISQAYDTGARNAAIYPVTRSWTEGTGLHEFDTAHNNGANWTVASPGVLWTAPGGDYNAQAISTTLVPLTPGWIQLDITNNYQNQNGYLVDVTGDWREDQIASKENANTSIRPVLEIGYTINTPVDSTAPTLAVVVNALTNVAATINAATNENATITLDYGSNTNYGTRLQNQGVNVNFPITGLTEKTTYYYKVNATDAAGNSNVTTGTFTTLDLTAPVISNNVVTPTETNATLSLNTNEASTVTLSYGPTLAYGTNQVQSGTTFNFALTPLNALTVYYYKVNATDAAGNSVLQLGNFTTLDLTAPVITTTSAPAGTTAVITVNTNEQSNVIVTIPSITVTQTSTNGLVHTFTATGLNEQTRYTYSIDATDTSGNKATTTGAFTTLDVTAPTINVLNAPSGNYNVLTITTNEAATLNVQLAGSQVDLVSTNGLTKTYNITGLSEKQTYSVQITATDASSNTANLESQFTTLDLTLPITTITNEPSGNYDILTVITNEPTTVLVDFPSPNVNVVSDDGITHVYNITELSETSTYFVQITTLDLSGNRVDEDAQFTTLDTTAPQIQTTLTNEQLNYVLTVTTSEDANIQIDAPNAQVTQTTTNGLTKNYAINGLQEQTTYTYTVTATDASNNQATVQEQFTTLDYTAPVINITQVNPLETSAVIEITTSEDADIQLIAPNAVVTKISQNPSSATFNLTGLTSLTNYEYQVIATDASQNTAQLNSTLATLDLTAPIITLTNAPDSTFDILTVEANEPAEINVTLQGAQIELISAQLPAQYNISGLSEQTTYNVSVTVVDASGNQAVQETQFTTLDKTAPQVTNTSFDDATQTLTIQLNELAAVELTAQSITMQSPLGLTHTFNLSMLPDGTVDYTVTLTDASSNTGQFNAQVTNPDSTMPAVLNTQINTTHNTTAIQLQTSENTRADLTLTLGGLTVLTNTSALNTVHQFNVRNLTANTTYQYTLNIADAAGNQITQTGTITTQLPPKPSDFLTDIAGMPYENEIRQLVDSQCLNATGTKFNPDANLTTLDEFKAIMCYTGLINTSVTTPVLCKTSDAAYNKAVNLANYLKITKYTSCPSTAGKRTIASTIVDVARAYYRTSQQNYQTFLNTIQFSEEQDYYYATYYGITNTYYYFGQNANALPGIENYNNDRVTTYGSKVMTRAEFAAMLVRATQYHG